MAILTACKSKEEPENGEKPVQVSEFIEYFPAGNLPYEVSDTTITRKEKDTTTIQYHVFTQFVPDSVIAAVHGKTKPKVYPLMRTFSGDAGSYLFAKTIGGDRRAIFILTFNSNNEYTGAMPLLLLDASNTTRQVSGVDRKLSIYKNTYQRAADGSSSEGKEVFIHDPESKQFILIMTDMLDERAAEIVNPIDTFQKKNRFSGDYTRDKRNLVSIRDASGGAFNFFIHIDRNNGSCTGEIKGSAKFTNSNTAIYRMAGDPCSIQFNFTNSSVRLSEVDACGNKRGVQCAFEGVFPKKREQQRPPKKPKVGG